MKPLLIAPSQDTPPPVAAVASREIGPESKGRAFCALARLAITESQAAKLGLLERWQSARRRQQQRAEKKATVATELNQAVTRLLQYAEAEHWSQRKLARRSGLSWGAWLRARDGKANPATWQPKLSSALNRLHPSTLNPHAFLK